MNGNGSCATVKPLAPVPTPNQVALSLTGRDHISHSQIAAFQACSLKWHYQYVEHAPAEDVCAGMLVGTCVHAALQRHLETHLAADTPPTLDELMATYRQTWKTESQKAPVRYNTKDSAESLESTAQMMLEQFLQTEFARPNGQILGIEESLRIRLAEDLPDLAVRVDLIEAHNHELVITDFKTARSMWSPDTADEHAQQLVLYGHAAGKMAEELKATVRLQFIVLTKAKTPKVEAITVGTNPDRVTRTISVARQVFRAMRDGYVFPSPSPMNCSGCSFRQRCERWHRSPTQE